MSTQIFWLLFFACGGHLLNKINYVHGAYKEEEESPYIFLKTAYHEKHTEEVP